MINYIYIFGTIFFTVYGQLIIKWRVASLGSLPDSIYEKIVFLTKFLLDPYVMSGFLSAFVASFFWMAAMTKFELSYAYPFTIFSYVLVLLFSGLVFHETIGFYKIVGSLFIILGILIVSKDL